MLPLNDILSGQGSGEIRNISFDRPIDISLPRQQGSGSFSDYLERARSEDITSSPRNDSMNRPEHGERIGASLRTDTAVTDQGRAVRREAVGSGTGGSDAGRGPSDQAVSTSSDGKHEETGTVSDRTAGEGTDGSVESGRPGGGEGSREARHRAEAAGGLGAEADAGGKVGAKARHAGPKTAAEAAGLSSETPPLGVKTRAGRNVMPADTDAAASSREAVPGGTGGTDGTADPIAALLSGNRGTDASSESAKAGAKARNGSKAEPSVRSASAAGEPVSEQSAAALFRGKSGGTAASDGDRKESDREKEGAKARGANGTPAGRARDHDTGVRLEVVDLRKEAAAARQESASEGSSDSTGSIRGGERHAAAPMEGAMRFADANPAARGAGRDGQEQFHRFMQQQGNEDVVRQAKVVLRDGGSGEIRLRLQPDHLGTVRISLRIEENHITGRIIVDNGDVKEAFQQNLPALQRAFGAEGFQSAGIEVSVGDDGKGRRERQDLPDRFVREAEEDLARSVPNADIGDRGLVNLFV